MLFKRIFIEILRAEYNEKTKQLKEKMSEFRAEIESLKVEDRQTEHDRIHAANVQKGIDKYSTLRKVFFQTFSCISLPFSLKFHSRNLTGEGEGGDGTGV